MKAFLSELRSRSAEGYSARQPIRSHIPDIGTDLKVSPQEVTAEAERLKVVLIMLCLHCDFLFDILMKKMM